MSSPAELRPARSSAPALSIHQAKIACPELSRFLYTAVGGSWYWIDRLGWTYRQWLDYLDRPELETWVGYVEGTPAGYFELEQQPQGSVEIAYFGLLPQFIGKGLGGRMLTRAVERAWEMESRRVWVHTCTLDGPAALANYRARGFRLFNTEVSEIDLPDHATGPWPNASLDNSFS